MADALGQPVPIHEIRIHCQSPWSPVVILISKHLPKKHEVDHIGLIEEQASGSAAVDRYMASRRSHRSEIRWPHLGLIPSSVSVLALPFNIVPRWSNLDSQVYS